MMAEISTEYRGYTIRYSENADYWHCFELDGKGQNDPSLAKMKARIDALLLAERKANAVPCVILSGVYGYENLIATDGMITQYMGPKIDRYGKPPRVSGHTVAVTGVRRGKDRVSRQENPLSDHARPGPETDAKVKEAAELSVQIQDLVTRRESIIKSIPRMTLEDIAPLVKISGIDPTGGLG